VKVSAVILGSYSVSLPVAMDNLADISEPQVLRNEQKDQWTHEKLN